MRSFRGRVEQLRFVAEGRRVASPVAEGSALVRRDQVQTFEDARAVVGLRSGTVIEMGELSLLEVREPGPAARSWLNLLRGALYFFSHEPSGETPVGTPHATGAHDGTEFALVVDEDQTLMAVFEGRAHLGNASGTVELERGEMAVVRSGQRPVKAAIQADHVVQWWLFYPAVLDPGELPFEGTEREALAMSLRHYRSGDLRAALESIPGYPGPARPGSAAGRVFLAGLYLSAGEVRKAAGLLEGLEPDHAGAKALEWLIRAVRQDLSHPPVAGESASECLGLSYYHQARHDLDAALGAATRAAGIAPDFALAWERVAELEFSFGRIAVARRALDQCLARAPLHAQARALQGFLYCADRRFGPARAAFEAATRLDPGLGNGWLGRGLVEFAVGDRWAGLEHLRTAALMEPNRSLLRSYLGKGLASTGKSREALDEFATAERVDPMDPTPAFYAALLRRDQRRANEAVAELERSIALNHHRAVFRSRLMLDQDRASRGANLAGIYREAGMSEVGLLQASRALADDYGNHAAHLFLANAYNELRDPGYANLRYETATFGEYLIGNLLAPVGTVPAYPRVSQQEYSRLFERDRPGFGLSTTYRSEGTWAGDLGTFGTSGSTAYAVDAYARRLNAAYPGNVLEQFAVSAQLKQQLAPRDSLLVQFVHDQVDSGDVRQRLDPASASPGLKVRERQSPNLFAGIHREWEPGVHTLVLAGWLDDFLGLSEPHNAILAVERGSDGSVGGVFAPDFDWTYGSRFAAATLELQHFWEFDEHTLVLGGQVQSGALRSRSRLGTADAWEFLGLAPVYDQIQDDGFRRFACYAYERWNVFDSLQLTGGLNAAALTVPDNADAPPVEADASEKKRVSPKAGVSWAMAPTTHLRGAYTRSLGGLFFDQSVRLEPTQVAGFNQAYRSLLPESFLGTPPGSDFETFQAGVDHQFPTRTYLALEADLLRSEGDRGIGFFEVPDVFPFTPIPRQARQYVDYEERSLALVVSQLLGDRWSIGARYRLSLAGVDSRVADPDRAAGTLAASDDHARMHQAGANATYRDPRGFFGGIEGLWWRQSHEGPTASTGSDQVWQLNLSVGYLFPNRRAEVSAQWLNLTDEDYRFSPLSSYGELPRHRTVVLSLRVSY